MPERYCGIRYECPNEATVQVLADSGGTFGWCCADCADELNRFMERMMQVNELHVTNPFDMQAIPYLRSR